MNIYDEVKKMLEEFAEEVRQTIETPDITFVMVVAKVTTARDKATKQICHLFPKTSDNPYGYEPKPDEGRLLTKRVIAVYGSDKVDITEHLKAQDAKTASIKDQEWRQILRDTVTCKDAECQAKVEGIFAKIEQYADSTDATGKWFLNISEDKWQALKAQATTPAHKGGEG